MIAEPAIPIRNLFHLLAYAWDHRLDDADERDFTADSWRGLNHLFARILCKGAGELLRIGLDRSYINHEETSPRIRGRIDFAASSRQQTWRYGRMHCEFNEFSRDVLHNRIIKTTLGLFENDRELGRPLLAEIGRCLDGFAEVRTLAELRPTDFRLVQLHRNNRCYRFLLSLCELIHGTLLPDRSRGGTRRFRDFTRNEKVMARVFESFVLNFARRHLPGYEVKAMALQWQARGASEAMALLPEMRTDVTLISRGRRVILDCKYYADALNSGYRDESGLRRFHSGNLYQLNAYLTNAAAACKEWTEAEGILLYPAAGSRLDQSLMLFGQHPLRIVTLDLGEPWPEVERSLVRILTGVPSV